MVEEGLVLKVGKMKKNNKKNKQTNKQTLNKKENEKYQTELNEKSQETLGSKG